MCLECSVSATQSAKTNLNVEQVFFTIARDIKQRLSEAATKTEVSDLCSEISVGAALSGACCHVFLWWLLQAPTIVLPRPNDTPDVRPKSSCCS